MSNKIVQLENENGDNIYPIAGGALTGSISKTMLEEGVFEGPELSEPSTVAYVATDNIQDGAVTSDKIGWTTIAEELYYNEDPVGSTASISLAKSISNYRSIDVCYKDDQLFSRVIRVYTNYSTGTVNFVLDMSKSSAVSNTIFVSSRRCEANGQTITIGTERNTKIENGSYPAVATSTNLKIYAVYGNKY